MRLRFVSVTIGGNTPTLGGSLTSVATSMTLAGALLDGQGNEITVTSPDILPVCIDGTTEADAVAPQKTFTPEQARCLGAADELVRRGGIKTGRVGIKKVSRLSLVFDLEHCEVQLARRGYEWLPKVISE